MYPPRQISPEKTARENNMEEAFPKLTEFWESSLNLK
jgi:hypothetical protein